ncbi:MAG: CCDC90 family protein [Magnetococcus sp. THC-1_WYH]
MFLCYTPSEEGGINNNEDSPVAASITFDTLAYANRMKSVGFTNEQAEALAQTQAELIEERLATKHDLTLLRKDLQLDMKEQEFRIITRLGGIIVVGFSIMGVLVKIL